MQAGTATNPTFRPMGEYSRPADVAILAFPEATASVVYGFHDLFHSTGRDWGFIVDGRPGPGLMVSRVLASRRAPFIASNGVSIAPDDVFSHTAVPDIVCVPEIMVPPGEWLDGRFTEEIDWLCHCFAAGATIATAC